MTEDKALIKPHNGYYSESEKETIKPAGIVCARAVATVVFEDDGASLLANAGLLQGDILSEARVAGVQAAKRAHEFIPLPFSQSLDFVSVDLSVEENTIAITARVRAVSRASLDAHALSAASATAVTLLNAFRKYDPNVSVRDLQIIPEKESKEIINTAKMPIKVGIVVVSDRVVAGLAEDEAGAVLRDGFKEAGFDTRHYSIISNDSDKLVEKFQEWLEEGVELIMTCGGNGLGRRDITLGVVEPFFDFRIEGIEQSLYSVAREHHKGLFTQRLAAGKIGQTVVICLPLDGDMARSSLHVLLPNIQKAFEL